MAFIHKNWIALNRSIQDHPYWQDKPFAKGQAWIDLLLRANHKDIKVLINKNYVSVKRGEFITSTYKLAEDWGWTRDKVRWFLKDLENKAQIYTPLHTPLHTLLKICNYNKFQGITPQITPQITPLNNNINNINKDNIYIDAPQQNEVPTISPSLKTVFKDKKKNGFVPPTIEEVALYCAERANGINAEGFVDSNKAKGWVIGKNCSPMKDWRAVIRTWEKNQYEQGKQTRSGGSSADRPLLAG